MENKIEWFADRVPEETRKKAELHFEKTLDLLASLDEINKLIHAPDIVAKNHTLSISMDLTKAASEILGHETIEIRYAKSYPYKIKLT